MPRLLPVKLRVALADDDRSGCHATRGALEDLGALVTEVTNGAELRRILTGERFDVIVTDLVMPRVTGIGMLLEARARGILTPAVVLCREPDRARSLIPPRETIIVVEKPCLVGTLRHAVLASLRPPSARP